MRIRAPARQPLQRGVGFGSPGSRAADVARATTNCRRPRKRNRIPFSAASRSKPGATCFRSTIEQPRQFASHRVALVGESAHVVPPIGAQGLNMGLRDAADIADIAAMRSRSGRIPGSPAVLARYQSARRADVASRTDCHRCRQPLAAQRFPARCNRCARPACICSVRSARCGGSRCARGWRRPEAREPERARREILTETPAVRSE